MPVVLSQRVGLARLLSTKEMGANCLAMSVVLSQRVGLARLLSTKETGVNCLAPWTFRHASDDPSISMDNLV